MVEFSDLTLIETGGYYRAVRELMDGQARVWMLRTTAVVSSDAISTRFILHLWNDGRVVIRETDRPLIFDLPEDDIRLLAEWCKQKGWSRLEVHNDLVEDLRSLEFWMHFYRAGLVHNDFLRRQEESERRRLQLMEENGA